MILSYLWIESVGDTIIHEKSCRVLENNGGLICAFWNEKNYVYYEDSTAYFYVPEIDCFQVLYDLKTQKDSSWTVVFGTDLSSKLDTIEVFVDSISYIKINSQPLKKLHVSYKSLNFGYEDYNYGSEIIERIGDTYYLFHLYSLSGVICDGNWSEGLRCYEDPEFGFYSTGIADSCTYTYDWNKIDEKNTNSDFTIYPNPTSDWLRIKSNIQANYQVIVFDVSGTPLITEKIFGDSMLDLSQLARGFYFIQFMKDDQISGLEKVLKK